MSACNRMTETFVYIEEHVTYAFTCALKLILKRFAAKISTNFVSDSLTVCESTGTFGVTFGLQTCPESRIKRPF